MAEADRKFLTSATGESEPRVAGRLDTLLNPAGG